MMVMVWLTFVCALLITLTLFRVGVPLCDSYKCMGDHVLGFVCKTSIYNDLGAGVYIRICKVLSESRGDNKLV